MVWTHIHLEGYCMFSNLSKKTVTTVDLNGKNRKVRENTGYIDRRLRPGWCKKKFPGRTKRIPQYKCMYTGKGDKMCPFFAFTDCDKEEMMLFEELYDVMAETCHDKEYEIDKSKIKQLSEHIKSFRKKHPSTERH